MITFEQSKENLSSMKDAIKTSATMFDFDASIKRAMESPDPKPMKTKTYLNESDLVASCIPSRHKEFEADQSNSCEWTEKYEVLKNKIRQGCLLAILGNRGTGKTQLATCLMKYAMSEVGGHPKSTYYTKAMDIFLRIRQGLRKDGDSEKAAVEYYLKPYLLVIDAYEVRGETDFENRTLDHIVDKRYDNLQSTIIISNHTREVFKKQVGASICDRITETGGVIELIYDSFRKIK